MKTGKYKKTVKIMTIAIYMKTNNFFRVLD